MIRKIQEYFIYFILYSIIGWCYEVFLEVFIYRWGFSNRGVMFGPYCIVYGFGALLLIFLLSKLKKKKMKIKNINITPIIMFISIVIITTIVELIASYIMEFTSGSWLWDYTRFSFNFEGRICLLNSCLFGVGGVVLIHFINPTIYPLLDMLPNNVLIIIGISLMVIFLIDLSVSIKTLHEIKISSN